MLSNNTNWNSWRGPGPPDKLQNPKGINYLIFFASIFALFSRSHSTFDFLLDNTDSLFALFLILVNPIYVWDVFNVTIVTTFLFDGEIDVPKIGKSRETFYNQYITPGCFLIFQTRENLYFEGQVSSKHKQNWAFYCPSKTLPIRLKYNNSIDLLFLFGNHLFPPKTEIIPNNWNAIGSIPL